MGCVYLIKHRKMEPIKIGYSSSPTPSKRIESMGTYAPFGVELIGWFTHPQAVAIEKKLHKQYAPFRLNGEWFNITKEQAKAIIYSYDNSFPDRAQRALLKQESWDSVDSDNDIRMTEQDLANVS